VPLEGEEDAGGGAGLLSDPSEIWEMGGSVTVEAVMLVKGGAMEIGLDARVVNDGGGGKIESVIVV